MLKVHQFCCAIAILIVFSFASSQFACGQTLNGTTLVITGSNNPATPDDILITMSGANLVVNDTGVETQFLASEVELISVSTEAGNDRIQNDTAIPMSANGGGGNDTIIGGSGDDLIVGLAGQDSLFGRDGNDNLDGHHGDDFLSGGNGNDLLRATQAGDNIMFGGPGDDIIIDHPTSSSDSELHGGGGDDRIDGHFGDDLITGGSGDDLIDGDDGDDLITGGSGDDTLNGGPGADSIFGQAGMDIIWGGGGGDIELDGGPDLDIVDGVIDEFVVIFQLSDGDILVSGGPEEDEITLSEIGGELIIRMVTPSATLVREFDLASVGNVIVQGHEANDSLENSSSVVVELDGGSGDDYLANLSATATDSVSLFGRAGNDILINGVINGGEGRTELFGGDGDDLLINNGEGATGMRGEAGDDFYSTNHESDFCSNRDGGNDVYMLRGGTVFHAVPEDEVGFHSIVVMGSDQDEEVRFSSDGIIASGVSLIMMGPGNDIVRTGFNEIAPITIRGGAGDDFISGGRADNNERLFGDAGNDFMSGGVGSENMFGGAGDDMMAGSFAPLTSGAPNMGLSESPLEVNIMRGGPGDDVMHGGLGTDLMFGGLGDDMLFGRTGDDVLRGEAGNDRLQGDPGDDRLFGDNGNDELLGGSGDDRLVGGNGDDILVGGPGDDVEIQ